jgi:aspartyl-tRNA(Asn)/glutamyl-tRNA(Gln) amidotransferase subunit C
MVTNGANPATRRILMRAMAEASARTAELTIEAVRRVAMLSRLAVDDDRLALYQHQLGSVLRHIKMLGELNLEGVEPLAHPLDATNRWDEDEPRPGLENADLMRMAPEKAEPFVRVPKVLGEGSGA